MSPLRVSGWLAFWEEKLRLRDWSTTAGLVPENEIAPAAGTCSHILNHKAATIRVADNLGSVETEEVLVHELLHLHFAPFESKVEGSPVDVAQEQAIQLIAEALVSLRRA